MKGEVLLPVNYLEVGLTPDGCEVIINHPNATTRCRMRFSLPLLAGRTGPAADLAMSTWGK